MFSKDLIQAVSDWQRGGDAKQKRKRGLALKEQARMLPASFRATTDRCYRQVALDETSLRVLGTQAVLTETIAAWSKDEQVVQGFKGGVPPRGHGIGVIFSIIPPPGSVVIDLTALFADQDFQKAVEQFRPQVARFGDGIGRYGNSQSEVVIELAQVPLGSLHAWGGFSAEAKRIAEYYFGENPSAKEIQWVIDTLEGTAVQIGPNWVSRTTNPEAVMRLEQKLVHHAQRIVKRAGK